MYVKKDLTAHQNETFIIGLNFREFAILAATLEQPGTPVPENWLPTLFALRAEMAEIGLPNV